LTPLLRRVRWRPVVGGHPQERGPEVIVIGIDPHKQTHTAAAVGAAGALVGELTVAATPEGASRLLAWASGFGSERLWAIEDCRHVSRSLERFLAGRGERLVRVPPKLMAGSRRGDRRRGKSDPIDALAVARAALREPNLPSLLDDPAARELKLLLDHRDDLVAERTRLESRLRWHLHELELGADVPPAKLHRARWLRRLNGRLARSEQTLLVAIAREQLHRIAALTRRVDELERQLGERVRAHAPALLRLPGCGVLTAAKLVAETGPINRFDSDAGLALHAGVAPLDASSGRQRRHRLNRSGNRQLNCALHRIAITQARCHPPARLYLARRQAEGKTRREALRCLKRHLARTIYRTLKETPPAATPITP
jgi:transposase